MGDAQLLLPAMAMLEDSPAMGDVRLGHQVGGHANAAGAAAARRSVVGSADRRSAEERRQRGGEEAAQERKMVDS